MKCDVPPLSWRKHVMWMILDNKHLAHAVYLSDGPDICQQNGLCMDSSRANIQWTSQWSECICKQSIAVKLKVWKCVNPKNPVFELSLFNLWPSMPTCSVLCKAAVAQPNSLWSRQTVRQANLQLRPPPVKLDLALMLGQVFAALPCTVQLMYSHLNTSHWCREKTLVLQMVSSELQLNQTVTQPTGKVVDMAARNHTWPS